jgi:hypothetical protein
MKMDEQEKTQGEESTPENTREGDKPQSSGLVDDAYDAAERLEDANEKQEELLERQEALFAKQLLAGKAEAGKSPERELKKYPPMKEDETN